MSVLFFGGCPGMPYDVHQRLYAKVPGRLLSLHSDYVQSSDRWLELSEEFNCRNIESMFDSGAFTAWAQQEPAIDVYWLRDKHREFDRLCSNRFKAVWFISLDIIPGRPGNDEPTDEEIVDAMRRSNFNHKVLQNALGDRVIPVFHQFEGPDRLEEVLAINPNYICISPQNGIREEFRRSWARDVFSKLNGAVWTHGLATTGGEMMETIDWRSVDSTTWAEHGWNGRIRIESEGRLKTLNWDTADDRMLKKVDEICDELEITPDMLRARDPYDRYLFNAHVMTEWSKRLHAREVLA
jgi:hypothetical protein